MLRFLLYLQLIVGVCLNAQTPKLKIVDAKKNFGVVKKGKIVNLEYIVKNEGNVPLLITEYKVECSCTEVIIPKEPILQGKEGTIKVNFNTQTVYDRQDRTVLIYSNDPKSPVKIRFKGVVLK